jgi:hypothetical protein
MTAETQDASAALDVMDEIVTLERAEPDVLLSGTSYCRSSRRLCWACRATLPIGRACIGCSA